MKALILDGSTKKDELLETISSFVVDKLKEKKWTYYSFILRDLEIKKCTGCFGCWIKTPGICVTNDSSSEITKLMAQCDLAFFLTPVTFGGYSSNLKKALDRVIGNVLPFFTKVDGETHHDGRYDKHTSLVVVGNNKDGDSESEAIFKALSKRNAINFMPPYHATMVLSQSSNLEVIKEEVNGHIFRVENFR